MTSTSIYTPFTYCLTFLPTGQRYYGVRYSKKEVAHPSQLWTTYFTSSKIITGLIEEHGKDSFSFQIRKTFTTLEQACSWETKFLTRINAAKHPEWINDHNGNNKFYATEKSKQTQKNKCIEKYGVENNFQRHDVQEKVRETWSNKSDYDINLIKEKQHQTNLERYGYKNPFSNPKVQEQIKKTNIKKYGYEYSQQNPEIQQERKLKSLIETGYESSNQRPDVKLKLSLAAKNRLKICCPHCNKSGAISQMKRWHFDNCKLNRI